MTTEAVRISAGADGDFEAFVAAPASGPAPGLVILAEIYNANTWVRSIVERYAQAGYLTIAPDLYWRQTPGVYLPYTPEGQQRGRAMGAAMDLPRFVEDLRACADWLRRRPDCSGRVGAIGYCLGGKLVWVGMSQRAIDAGVAYYAVQMAEHLDDAKTIDGPLMMHFGSLDHRVPPELYEQIRASLAGRAHAHTYWYEGADHGFDRDGHPSHHPESSALARKRSLEFLGQHLGGTV